MSEVDQSVLNRRAGLMANGNPWPTTVDAVVGSIIEQIRESERNEFATSKTLHHTLGMWIRNNYGLWAVEPWPWNKELVIDCWKRASFFWKLTIARHWKKEGLWRSNHEHSLGPGEKMHADDASHVIIVALQKKLRG